MANIEKSQGLDGLSKELLNLKKKIEKKDKVEVNKDISAKNEANESNEADELLKKIEEEEKTEIVDQNYKKNIQWKPGIERTENKTKMEDINRAIAGGNIPQDITTPDPKKGVRWLQTFIKTILGKKNIE